MKLPWLVDRRRGACAVVVHETEQVQIGVLMDEMALGQPAHRREGRLYLRATVQDKLHKRGFDVA